MVVKKKYSKNFLTCLNSQLLLILKNTYPQLLKSQNGEIGDSEEIIESEISRNILKRKRNRITYYKKLYITLRECILHDRINDAALVLPILARNPTYIMNTLWRAGFEVLWKHPNSNKTIMNLLTNRLENSGGLPYTGVLEAKLEYCFYYLYNNEIALAKEYFKYPNFKRRYAKRSFTRTQILELTYKGYAGMLEYLLWLERKKQAVEENYMTQQSLADTKTDEFMKKHSNQALQYFKKATNKSGNWDIFISKHIEILSYYEHKDEALEVLENYKDKNKDNPNAYRYLYKFQKENGASTTILINLLEDYIKLVPSDSLALDLFELYMRENYDAKTILSLLFNMLDYACWKYDVNLWKIFSDYLVQIYFAASKSDFKAIRKCWQLRSSWWPKYHFRINIIKDRNVIFSKCKVQYILLGGVIYNYKDYLNDYECQFIDQLACVPVQL